MSQSPTFTILGSNSSGNSALLVTSQCRILIDAGFSGKRTCELLETLDLRAEDLDGVFLTHEHSDHASGVRGLSRCKDLRFFANRQTAEAIQRPLNRKVHWTLFETGATFQHIGLKVHPLSIPHDAYDPVGFIFEFGEGTLFSPHQSLAWITDLGFLTQGLSKKLEEVDYLVIEANHDETLVQKDSKRPWSVKQRILGRHGHLSNRAVRSWMESVDTPHWKQVHLVHLSRDCNSAELVEEEIVRPMAKRGVHSISIHDPACDQPVTHAL